MKKTQEFEKDPTKLCPCCRKPLVSGKQEVFETLGDHVCDPNGIPPLRTTWVCSTDYCDLQGKMFWDDYGDSYSSGLGYTTRKVLIQYLKHPDKESLTALNSWALKNNLTSHSQVYDGFTVFIIPYFRWKLRYYREYDLMGNPVSIRRFHLEKQYWGHNGWCSRGTFWSGLFNPLKSFYEGLPKAKKKETFWSFNWKDGFYELPRKGRETRLGYSLAYWYLRTFYPQWVQERSY